MKCFSPTSVPDPRIKNKRVRITVPCGKCAACISNKRNDWATRLRLEAKYQNSAYFITLTYSNDNIPIGQIPNQDGELLYQLPTLVKKDIQDFMKRVRKGLKEKVKYFVVGEYGSKTWRPHYHLLLFGIEKTGIRLKKYILEKWDKGLIDIGVVTPASIRYCTNYIIQKADFQNPYIESPFALMSKGLGKQYLEKHTHKHKRDLERNYIVFEDGQKSRVPRYFRNKMLTKPAIEKQNKLIIDKVEEETELNWQKWARLNPTQNKFEYEYDQQKLYSEKLENSLKKNNKL